MADSSAPKPELDRLLEQLMGQIRSTDWLAQQQRQAAEEGRKSIFDEHAADAGATTIPAAAVALVDSVASEKTATPETSMETVEPK
jgi:hypothetical protein